MNMCYNSLQEVCVIVFLQCTGNAAKVYWGCNEYVLQLCTRGAVTMYASSELGIE